MPPLSFPRCTTALDETSSIQAAPPVHRDANASRRERHRLTRRW
jgi:hypothetical protein